MKSSPALRATIRAGARYLEAGQPTGLTGLLTHHSPRTALLTTYRSTLEKLQRLPESSVYRKSVEALTKHRIGVIESIKPEGYDAWWTKLQEEAQNATMVESGTDGLQDVAQSESQKASGVKTVAFTSDNPEPQLSIEQIGEIESKIAAGLIEEVLQVAQAEDALIDTMVENQVWEELVEKPVEGQWVYHERDTHVPKTQAP